MRMKMTKAVLALTPVALSLMIAGCTNEELVNEKITKYEQNFKETFGDIDPTHDWSMATAVTANIDLSKAPAGTYEVKIYSEKNGYLLKKAIVENNAQLHFDAIKGEKYVRVLARKTSALGLTAINGYFPVKDGVVNTAKDTRAASTADQCNTTVGTEITDLGYYAYWYVPSSVQEGGSVAFSLPTNDNIYYITAKEGEVYSNTGKGIYSVTHNGDTYDCDMKHIKSIVANYASGQTINFFYYTKENNYRIGQYSEYWNNDWNDDEDTYLSDPNNQYSEKYKLMDVYILHQGSPAYISTSNPNLQNQEEIRVNYEGNFYYLNDVYKSIDESSQVAFADLIPIVSPTYGDDAYFQEAKDNREKYKDKLDPDIEYVLTEEGPITFTPVFYGSDFDNELGYFYWFETEGMTEEQKKAARRNAPRYVFMQHTFPHIVNEETGKPNIACNPEDPSHGPHGGMIFPTWMGDEGNISQHEGHMIQGTTYHLAYFGEQYNLNTGSYDFPEGVHVGFFIFASKKINQEKGRGSGLFYTIEDMNLEDGINDKHWYGTGGYDETTGLWLGENYSRPDRIAVTYSYEGSIVMGFEDWNDYDMNDILYFISAPITPPNEITEEKEEEMSWVVACEDLGGTYDYDFNDIVFDLGQLSVYTTTTTTSEGQSSSTISLNKAELFLRPLAAGGTLPAYIYFDKNGDGINSDDELIGEAHDLLKAGAPTTVAINVGGMSVDPKKVARIKLADIDIETAAVTEEGIKSYIAAQVAKIKIVVNNGGTKEALVITAPDENGSNIPQMLILPRGWDWPTEHQHIFTVYPQFKEWSTDKTKNGWITDPIGSFYPNPFK